MNRPSHRRFPIRPAVVLALACTVFAASTRTETLPAGGRTSEVSPNPQSGEGGWKELFDGKTTAGWRGYRQKTLPDGWQVVDGALTRVGKGGDIVSLGEFENFELTLDWKIPPGGNSGIFYRVVEHDEDTEMWMAAPEYQLIDDTGYPGTLKPTQKTAANYDLQPPGRDATKPAGSWNSTRILVNGSHVEHWLNGQLIVSYDLWTDEWNRLVAQSKFKDHPRYARARKGRIGLQDHGAAAAFRNIRIRELPPTPQTPAPAQPASPIPPTRLQTRWASQVTPDRVLPEYPRPQMARKFWTNLNGPWSYAITAGDAPRPSSFDGRILVPFPVESQLSGAGVWVSPQQRLWYRRTFATPALPSGGRLLLNFGAVDWEAEVLVNGTRVGVHRGGYDPFTFDITDQLRPGAADQELVVAVRDPTDEGQQPRGKQVRRPRSIWYTAVTGIWQTVWLETVPGYHVSGMRIDPDLDRGVVRVSVGTEGRKGAGGVTVTVLDGAREVGRAEGPTAEIPIPAPHKWSPADPFLYTLLVNLPSGDQVQSYFGMRSIAVRPDASGVNRLFLNGQPLFQFGPLDQGWWPDGLYTAPTDEALAFDIKATKDLGFNVIRKHVKVEPARWYYHADRLGMLVWQDMPSADNKGPEAQANFAHELQVVVDSLRNHPSIVMWVPFNEGWGQHATEKTVAWLKSYDPTRLVDNTSGWTDAKVGDVADHHAYPGPAMPPLEPARAATLGEFGGLGLPTEGHTWLDKGNWGYRSYTSPADLNTAYRDLLTQLRLHIGDGLSSAIYTQTTDVEIEVNGVMTYDRAVTKLSPESVAANRRMYEAPPRITHIVPASDRTPQTWRYTTTAPSSTWFDLAFDDGPWQSGAGGFGAPDTRFARVGTEWKTSDIWLRRTVDLPAGNLTAPYLRVFHDDDAQIYVNGILVAELPGSNAGFAYVPLTGAARAALRPGKNTLAVHAHQIRGGQFIDVGIVDVLDPASTR
jgi:3-keto-disaccharide hydrolase/glycosyl hydrolase family 2